MDARLTSLCKEIVKMTSDQAAAWIMSEYPINSEHWSEALVLIPHRSWKKSEQRLLAEYYFKNVPFSSGRGYEAFASIMSIKLMIARLKDAVPRDPARCDLMQYYLIPVLERFAKNDTDRMAINDFVCAVSAK